jgi:hypothetical protein
MMLIVVKIERLGRNEWFERIGRIRERGQNVARLDVMRGREYAAPVVISKGLS